MRALADLGWVTCIALALAIGLIAAVQGTPGWVHLATAAGIGALLPSAQSARPDAREIRPPRRNPRQTDTPVNGGALT